MDVKNLVLMNKNHISSSQIPIHPGPQWPWGVRRWKSDVCPSCVVFSEARRSPPGTAPPPPPRTPPPPTTHHPPRPPPPRAPWAWGGVSMSFGWRPPGFCLKCGPTATPWPPPPPPPPYYHHHHHHHYHDVTSRRILPYSNHRLNLSPQYAPGVDCYAKA